MIKIRNSSTDRNIILEIAKLIHQNKIIPVIGSGFTRNCNSHKGHVPSGSDTMEHMLSFLKEYIPMEEYNLLQTYDFKKVSGIFHKRVPWSIRKEYYINKFTEVELPVVKRSFLSAIKKNWYTLNIDDALERYSNRRVVLPNSGYRIEYFDDFNVVFKIHGDVHDILQYNEKSNRGIIFDEEQYVQSLNKNQAMLSRFMADFSESNMIYLGCRLDDEIDLLSVIQDSTINSITSHSTYYVSNEPIKQGSIRLDILEGFGITDYIVIQDISLFCKMICEEIDNMGANTEFHCLDYYKEKPIKNISKQESNLDFLLSSDNLVKLPFTEFNKPYFFIERDIVKHIINQLFILPPIQIICGHRVSGKTYCLFSVYEKFENKERYFIPSGIKISTEMLNKVLFSKDCFFAFDTNTLTYSQINELLKMKDQLLRDKTYIVIAVNSSEEGDWDNNPFTLRLKNYFSYNESTSINNKFQNNNLPTFVFKSKKRNAGTPSVHTQIYSLLDNLCIISTEFHKGSVIQRFKLNTISDPIDLALVLLFATEQTIDMSEIFYYGLKNNLHDFIKKYPFIVNVASIDEMQNARNSSRIVNLNARYILMKELGAYANNSLLTPQIVNAYRYICDRICAIETDWRQQAHKMLDFIKYDVINDIFVESNESKIKLIKSIYQELEEQLNKSFQFKHQRAKTILWLCNNSIEDIMEAARYIDLAIYDIRNVLSSQTPSSRNHQISYAHMSYTQAIIYGRLCNLEHFKNLEHLEKAIQYYSIALTNPDIDPISYAVRHKRLENVIHKDLKNIIDYSLTATDIDDELKRAAKDLYDIINSDD